MTLADFLAHAQVRGAVVLREGSGHVMTCSAHDDKRPSLRVAEGRDGRVLLSCRARCRTEDVVAAMGLRLGDLFPATPDQSPRPRRSRNPLAAARAEADAIGRRQPWARALPHYEAADLVRRADLERSRFRTMTDDEGAWGRLAQLAVVTTRAENVLSDASA